MQTDALENSTEEPLMACVNTCSCDRGYIRDAVFDEGTQKADPPRLHLRELWRQPVHGLRVRRQLLTEGQVMRVGPPEESGRAHPHCIGPRVEAVGGCSVLPGLGDGGFRPYGEGHGR